MYRWRQEQGVLLQDGSPSLPSPGTTRQVYVSLRWRCLNRNHPEVTYYPIGKPIKLPDQEANQGNRLFTDRLLHEPHRLRLSLGAPETIAVGGSFTE